MQITKEQTIAALREVVEGREDYIYEPQEGEFCTYSNPDGGPSCIVGWVLAKLDPEAFEKIAGLEFPGDGLHPREFAFKLDLAVDPASYYEQAVAEAVGDFAPDAVNALSRAQLRQDANLSWGEAVIGAISYDIYEYDF